MVTKLGEEISFSLVVVCDDFGDLEPKEQMSNGENLLFLQTLPRQYIS